MPALVKADTLQYGKGTLLELKGLVRDLGGMQYVRVREDSADYDTTVSGSTR